MPRLMIVKRYSQWGEGGPSLVPESEQLQPRRPIDLSSLWSSTPTPTPTPTPAPTRSPNPYPTPAPDSTLIDPPNLLLETIATTTSTNPSKVLDIEKFLLDPVTESRLDRVGWWWVRHMVTVGLLAAVVVVVVVGVDVDVDVAFVE
jgi:hypothetical protein